MEVDDDLHPLFEPGLPKNFKDNVYLNVCAAVLLESSESATDS